MKEIGPVPLTLNFSSDPRWQLVLRVAESPHFRKGPKLRAFLLYVCEQALLGQPENLTTQLIACRVFGRPPEFNAAEDNIVRVEARELRKRLVAYFGAEGLNDPVVIEIPKGSYVPVFTPRGVEAAPPETDAEEPDSQNPPAPSDVRPPARGWIRPAVGAGLLLWIGATAWLLAENWRLGHRSEAPQNYAAYADLFGHLGSRPEREPLLVLSNPHLVMHLGASNQEPLMDSSEPTVQIPAPPPAFDFALNPRDRNLPYHFLRTVRTNYTGMGDAVAAFHVGRLMQVLGRSVRLTQSRFLNWDHVDRQDLILVGGPSSNDWSYQEDVKSNFVFANGGIDNSKPLSGEQARYLAAPAAPTSRTRVEYAVIKMLTSPYGFCTLVIGGIGGAGTAGAGQFLSTPERMKAVRDRIRAASPAELFPANWEVLVRIAIRDEIPIETSVAALRPAK